MTTVPIGTVLSDLWMDLSLSQKFIGIALAVLFFVALAVSWANTFKTWSEIHAYEAAAIEAERDKDEALATAAKIASEVKVREEELAKVEGKRDAKKEEVKRAADDVSRDRAEYDAAVKRRRPDAPSSDELCRQLAAVGHPCYPR